MINITLDGVSNNDNFLQVDRRLLRLGHSAAGRGRGGDGHDGRRRRRHRAAAARSTINFTTRSGTNRFSGSGYEYCRNPALNTNYWFNERNGLPKNDVKLNQYGAPRRRPDRDSRRCTTAAARRSTSSTTSSCASRTASRARARVLHPRRARRAGSATRSAARRGEVNVLQLAAANGQISTIDPTVMHAART